MATLYFNGHGSLRITTGAGRVIYIDPFAGEGYDLPADLVLISHEHYDHTDLSKLTLAENAPVFRAADLIGPEGHRTVTAAGVTVEATEACNKNHPIDKCVGFLLTVDGRTVYAAGDTSRTRYMEQVLAHRHVDWALLPCDGVYNMGPEEAGECAALIGAVHTVPIHSKPGGLFDEAQARRVQAEGRVILLPGDSIEL